MYSSQLLETCAEHLSRLPGVGKRTALRLALHILRMEEGEVRDLCEAIRAARFDVHYCAECHNISDTATCSLCADPRRDHATVCVVETVRDVMAVEATEQYNGVYHVLGGVISPMDGIVPDDLEVASLVERVAAGGIGEVILALSPTLEGDSTNYYIYKLLQSYAVKVTTLSRGVAIGDELQYADQLTLGRSIVDRVPYGAK